MQAAAVNGPGVRSANSSDSWALVVA